MNPVEAYLEQVRAIHLSGAGVPETSYYPALSNLFDEIGKTLNPKVRCIIHPANVGAGLPDGGLFTADQLRRTAETEAFTAQVPARGAIEVKPPGDSVEDIVKTEQLARYLERYRQVLVTNLREFALYGRDADGKTVQLEEDSLAVDERLFWEGIEHPRAFAQREGARLIECLKRVMLHAAPLATPQDLAAFLASYARDARVRLEGHDLPALASLREALEEALGMHFEGEKGEHFFRSTLVQTLFYGIFSAWVIWAQQHPRDDRTAVFDWRTAGWSIELPVLRTLFDLISRRSTLQPLDLVPLIDSACRALNRVDREAFFKTFEEGLAVQYFYEPFLQAFDPDLRKQLGVWYTPREIVQYQVARVDTVLREELKIADGLADPRVVVLDPCCGTGTYLVEVLKRIAGTLKAKGGDALLANDLKRAAQERIFGFEILPAPFVVAHLQLGLLLAHLGAPLSGDDKRAGVYLTNALTGWEPPKGPKQKVLPFPDLEEEREAADHVKRDQPILVILGNPPYNAFSGVSADEEHGSVDVYKEGLSSEWGIRKYNLDDLYVRFFRLAERRIAEGTGRGVVTFISNYSWAREPSFVVLRKRLLRAFDHIWVDNLHGNRRMSEYARDGRTSETVFAVHGFSPGIVQGVVVSLWVRRGQPANQGEVYFRDDAEASGAEERRQQLVRSLADPSFQDHYKRVLPTEDNRFTFWHQDVDAAYIKWPRLTELCAETPISGLQEMRRGALTDIDREALGHRIAHYLNGELSFDEVRPGIGGLAVPAGMFEPRLARERILSHEKFDPGSVRRYSLYPFDQRWCYWSQATPMWNRARPDLAAQAWSGNGFFVARMNAERPHENVPVTFTTQLPDYHLLRPNVVAIPMRLRSAAQTARADGQTPLFNGSEDEGRLLANFSAGARDYLTRLGLTGLDEDAKVASTIWMHALAIGHTPTYLEQNSDGVKRDFPRIPLPETRELLEASAVLGRQVAELLDPDTGVSGVSSGDIRPELRTIGMIAGASGKALDPTSGDLAVTAGWGHAGKGGVTMPGRGKLVERAYGNDERAAIEAGAAALGLSAEQAFAILGERCLDVALNDRAYWRCVPSRVWDYTIGGYQVLKKWLSYRERDLLGRDLTVDEVRYFMEVARRIAAILLLSPALDENYLRVKETAFDWASLREVSGKALEPVEPTTAPGGSPRRP